MTRAAYLKARRAQFAAAGACHNCGKVDVQRFALCLACRVDAITRVQRWKMRHLSETQIYVLEAVRLPSGDRLVEGWVVMETTWE